MKSQRVQFEAADGSVLRISLSKNRKGEMKTQVRHRDAGEGRVRIGMKNWFEPTDEDKAQTSYDELVRDAESRGWTPVQKSRKQKMAFTELPFAPKVEPPASSDEVLTKLKSTLKAKR